MSKRLEAWLFYKIKDLHTYSEDEKLFIKDIESLLAKVSDLEFWQSEHRKHIKDYEAKLSSQKALIDSALEKYSHMDKYCVDAKDYMEYITGFLQSDLVQAYKKENR